MSDIKVFAKGKKETIKKGGRAVIYQRVSSKEQEDGFSPITQLEICRNWAEQNGYEVVKEFAGEHESAKSDASRKRFNAMLKYVKDKKNKIDAVIVYSTSRFSRTGTKSFSIMDELSDRGIPVHSATSHYDSRTADGKMIQRMELLQAERENSIKSQAVKDNGAKALRSGRWIQKPPKGYDMQTTKTKQTITVNAEGDLIRLAFQMKLEGMSNEEVREEMKRRGLDLKKQRWSKIFRNPFYAGYFSHPFLQGEIIKGPQEPLVSEDDFLRINGIIQEAHGRGYEVKNDKTYAPLLGLLKCPKCGNKLTAASSTKMKKKYGRLIGYYVCSHKGCCCNASTKKVNGQFEQLLGGVGLSDGMSEMLMAQLRQSFPILNKRSQDDIIAIKTNLTNKEKEIERIEANIALAPNAKVQEVCSRQLERVEAEKKEIQRELDEKDKTILNLEDYVKYGMSLRGNMLKMWQIAGLSQKRLLQNLIFPDGIVWSKENDDIEPISKNEFLFTWGLKSGSYGENENGQTADFSNLSALAPPRGLEPRTP